MSPSAKTRRSHARAPVRERGPSLFETTVESVGARGDGVARRGAEPVFLPYTVPGDVVVARLEGRRGDGLLAVATQILEAGPERVAPPCPYFGRCGGCALQHWAPSAYRAWKRGLLVEALARAGCAADRVAPLVAIAPGSRRRVTFAYAKRGGSVTLGFNERASHRLVGIDSCLLLAPALIALAAPLRGLLATVGEDGEGDVAATLTETGLDVVIAGPARLDLFDRERLADFAARGDLARLSWRRSGPGPAEPVAMRRAPVVRFGGVLVPVPAAAFLQPSAEGERALAALVFDAVGDARRVADLYAGCGSFTFVLAQKAAVFAAEGDAEALAALAGAAAAARLKIAAEARDLARRPLIEAELKRFDAVVFDPPRAGAMAQAEALAADGPARVVAVSCNPATLARDARILMRGGYRLEKATPVDQFPWSPHLEAVAAFVR